MVGKRRTMVLGAGAACAMVLSACGGGEGGGGSGRVVFGESTDFPENLFPLIAAGNATSVADLEAQLFPSAFDVNPDFSVTYNQDLLTEEPSLDTSGGTQVNTYQISPDAVWSDGTPITADDFEFSWNLQKSADPADGGCPALLVTAGYDQITSVEGSGPDNKTVTVTYATPYSDWQRLWSGAYNPVFPAHVMEEETPQAQCDAITEGWPTDSGIPADISGGPWQIKAENIDAARQIVVLAPNPQWWGEPTGLSQLVIQNIGSDPATTVQGLESGELGVIYPQPQLDLISRVDDLKPDVESQVTFGLTFEHVDFNVEDPLLSSLAVRQAFAMALDRQEIVDQTVGQFSDEAQVLQNRIYFNTQPQYEDTAPEQYKEQNVDAAKQLLESEGWALGSDGVYAKNGQRLSIRIDTTADNPLRQTTIEVMIPQLAEAGIEATFNANPDIFAGADRPTSLVAGGFQAAVFAWAGSPFRGEAQALYKQPENGNIGSNYSRGGTAEIDDLFAQFQTEPDPEAQADIGNQIDAALWELMATVPLYQKPTLLAYRSNISGVEDNSTQAGPLWNSSSWTVE